MVTWPGPPSAGGTDRRITPGPRPASQNMGELGSAFHVSSNFFRLLSKLEWRLLKYRVDISPDIDCTEMRKAMVYQHKETKLMLSSPV